MPTTNPWELFERHRPRLLGIAYRMLGSMWDAEDVVADAQERWLAVDHATLREPGAYLTTMVSRLALDELRRARRTRERYVGPWLPEPVLTAPGADPLDADPLELVERRESLHLATLRLLEQLTPPERAAYVLREAFELPFEQIADVVDTSEANARQLLHRARQHMGRDGRFEASPEQHAELLERFLDAVAVGDLDPLRELLASDVAAYADGGGKVRAALVPVVGRDAVLAFLASVIRQFPVRSSRTIVANGLPAARVAMGEREPFVALEVRAGLITAVHTVMNPDKLRYLDAQLSAAD